MSSRNNRRPDRTTMAGMIWNANHVLDQALSPDTNGIPRSLFQQCHGILLLSIVEAGFIFTGNVGTGIMLAKNSSGCWSPPCAMGMTGIGWGFVVGGSIKDLVVFLMDHDVVDTLACGNSMKIGGELSATLGPIGRDASLDIHLSGRGVGATAAFSFSQGIFGGVAAEGAMVGAKHAVNEMYYRKEVHPREILFHNNVTVPQGSLMPEIYKKLNLLAEGMTYTPDEHEKAKVEQARAEADKAGEGAKGLTDVEYVDASLKAAQEGTIKSAEIPMDGLDSQE